MSSSSIENLYPALSECFVIIICGYFAGRMNLISETEAKGLNTFVGTFSLPSLIFMSLAKLDLTSVNWLFLASVLIAKSVVFFTVIIITLLVGRPLNLGRAGLFAIFCTQSNDFAIGYPIVAALYKNTHPEYASYLYLVAPVNLAILNPVGFVLMEIAKQRRDKSLIANENSATESVILLTSLSSVPKKCQMAITITKSIFMNPIVAMTILGIVGNIIFKHSVPSFLGSILEVLGAAFTATALFLLGLRMVGKVQTLQGAALIVPGILIMIKLLVLPLVTREVVSLLSVGTNTSDTLDWSTYGFLYGTFPAAPSVFVFATQYGFDIDLIASAMVACTFISAPVMYVSAKMISIRNTDPSEYIGQLNAFTFDVSIIGMIASLWVLVIFIVTKKIKRIPHRFTAYLVLAQLLSCIGAILWNRLNYKEGWIGYVQFAIFTTGTYSARIWTSFLAMSLLFLQCRSLCYVLKLQPVFLLIGWGLPITLSAVFLLFDPQNSLEYDKRNPNFIYGAVQAVVAVSLLASCFIVTVGCLIFHQRYAKRYARYMDLAQDVNSTFNNSEIESTQSNAVISRECACSNSSNVSGPCSSNNICRKNDEICGNLPTIKEGHCESMAQSPVLDIEDLANKRINPNVQSDAQFSGSRGLCPTRYGCQGPQRQQCQNILDQYVGQINDDVELIEEEPESHDPQILRHIVLIISLLCSMFVGLALSVWTLVMEKVSGIYIELSFLDAALNFGQGIITFAIFGTNTKEIWLPILSYWKKIWYGANKLNLPAWHELSVETRHICDQFITHHLNKCKDDIAHEKRWRIKVYKDVFSGAKFVDWLIEVGLARDRIEAINYARYLIEGKVLRHINSVYHFYDRNLLYTFN